MDQVGTFPENFTEVSTLYPWFKKTIFYHSGTQMSHVSESPGGFDRSKIADTFSSFLLESAVEWGPRICIPNKLPNDDVTTVWGHTSMTLY